MEAYVNIEDEHIWDAVEGYVNDAIDSKLGEYVHDSDLECEVASYIEDKEVVTADMICDVTQFENRVRDMEEALAKLCDRSIEKATMINDCAGQILKNDQTTWAAIKDLQFNHDRWAGENAKIREENSVLREHIDYLFDRVNDLESRTLRGRWDTVTTWFKEKFNA